MNEPEYDIVIRNGLVYDGSNIGPNITSIGIRGDKIAAIGSGLGPGKLEIDAQSQMVMPGWIDIHTHYDAQVHWDPYLTPSSNHGVTTVVMGNCSVGLAPCKKQDRERLSDIVKKIEDIPIELLRENVDWQWEHYSEYRNYLHTKPTAINTAYLVPHTAIRTWCIQNDKGDSEATPKQIEAMAALTRNAMRHGAVGFSTSRTDLHKDSQGNVIPGSNASYTELTQIAEHIGRGVIQLTVNQANMLEELKQLYVLARMTKHPVIVSFHQVDSAPGMWLDVMQILDDALANDVPLFVAMAGRPTGILYSFDSSYHPFQRSETYKTLQHLPIDERLKELRKPEVKASILSDDRQLSKAQQFMYANYERTYRMYGDCTDYEPTEEEAVGTLEAAYDWMADGGILYFPYFDYAYRNLDHVYHMMHHPQVLISLGDGGAHTGFICDAGQPTFMMTYWTHDRRGPVLEAHTIIHNQTGKNADVFGFTDRGYLRVGYKADVNVVDYKNLNASVPRMVYDMPNGTKRFTQDAYGYTTTIVNGVVIANNGKFTGELPGHLL